jgi:hypothetical protein
MEKEHRGDSYVVNITPASSTFPGVQIIRRKRRREPGKVAQDEQLAILGRTGDFHDEQALQRLATQIGMQILEDSEIVSAFCPWMTTRTPKD